MIWRKPEGKFKMSRYQVLYTVGDPRYDGTPSEAQVLRSTVNAFQKEHRGFAICAVRASESLGMFTVQLENRLDAECLPSAFQGYERSYDVLEIA
jgi:hypothetical protein